MHPQFCLGLVSGKAYVWSSEVGAMFPLLTPQDVLQDAFVLCVLVLYVTTCATARASDNLRRLMRCL